MPAPDLATFYAVEPALVSAVVSALNTAHGSTIAYAQRGSGANAPELPVPRIDVYVTGTLDTEQTSFVPGTIPPTPYGSARRVSLALRVSARRGSTPSAATLLGLARRVLAIPAQSITSSNLPYHELLMITESSSAYSVGEEPETDQHLLDFDAVVGLPPRHYPV